mmetsp:Transcript_767/g.1524  ORF Transcript_767/g.1524 Transcript_767/m.1524 type:complete len:209 (+) Transcript_767:85-711(+)
MFQVMLRIGASACILLAWIDLSVAAPKPVDHLNATEYLGRWYQVYASATVKYTMELGANCVTADYGAVAGRDDEITVVNICHPLGIKVQVGGYAVADPARAGVFEVALGPPGKPADPSKPKPFSAGNYVVVDLGPVVDGKYDYSIVTDPSMISLYILARDAGRFAKLYDSDVLRKVQELGFTSMLNKPLKTNQDGCAYTEGLPFVQIV